MSSGIQPAIICLGDWSAFAGKDRDSLPPSKTPKTKWHPAFVSAMQLDFLEYEAYLEYTPELQLTMEPLEIDLLVIKKNADIVIETEIGRIFRRHNLLEYKSPTDYIAVKQYHKVMGYIHFYCYLHDVRLSEVTLTLITSSYPDSLMDYLTEERKFEVTSPCSGIYYVHGEQIPVQIVHIRKLSENNLWLSNLDNNLDKYRLERMTLEMQQHKTHPLVAAYFEVITNANPKAFKEVLEMSERMHEIYREFVQERGWERIPWVAEFARDKEQEGRRDVLQKDLQIFKELYLSGKLSRDDVRDALLKNFTPEETDKALAAWEIVKEG